MTLHSTLHLSLTATHRWEDSYPAFIGATPRFLNERFKLQSPWNTDLRTEVSNCGAAEADIAISCATQAFQSWKSCNPYDRSHYLGVWSSKIASDKELLAQEITEQMGKPIRQARAEIDTSIALIQWYAEEAKRLHGETLPSQYSDKRLLLRKAPLGVIFAITPWNNPASMVIRKVAPALAAGCTVILKPDERAPLTALHLAKIWSEIGSPADVFQVLPTANPETLSRYIIKDPRVTKISFTGSIEVGRQIYVHGAKYLKQFSLELGGHAPVLVFADADIEVATRMVIDAKFRNGGQSCIAANRLYIQRAFISKFLEALIPSVEKLVVGHPLREDTDIGPVVNQVGMLKLSQQIEEALQLGAHKLCGSPLTGLWCLPHIFNDVDPRSRMMHEESFGPVLPIQAFDAEQEGIALANHSTYGLAAYVATENLSRAYRVCEALEYGVIGVNDGIPSTPQAPFGGIRQSGMGKEGGTMGMEEFLYVQTVSTKITQL